MTQTVIVTCDSCGETTQRAVGAGGVHDWGFIHLEAEGSIPRLKHDIHLCPRCNPVFVAQFTTVMTEAMRLLRKGEVA